MNCWVNIASMLAYRRLCIVICVEAPSAFIMIVSALNIGLENCHLSISFLRKHFLTVPVSLKSRRLLAGFFSAFPLISKPISSFRGLQSRVIIRSFTVWLPALCRVVFLSNVYVHSSKSVKERRARLRVYARSRMCVFVFMRLSVCIYEQTQLIFIITKTNEVPSPQQRLTVMIFQHPLYLALALYADSWSYISQCYITTCIVV